MYIKAGRDVQCSFVVGRRIRKTLGTIRGEGGGRVKADANGGGGYLRSLSQDG